MASITCLECGTSVSERERFRCPSCGHSAYPARCIDCLYYTYYDEDGSCSCSHGIRIESGHETACVHYIADDSDD